MDWLKSTLPTSFTLSFLSSLDVFY
jgi:hypothetical protein